MARASTKFGTFGGVFVPSILTILGVIMYLRLPWVLGSGGLYPALGIILAAHVISVTTGLSISSIATDKKVGAGGPYYIVSRSLGLPIGGTLGLALFVGLSFSISLYVIGFSESFLSTCDGLLRDWFGIEDAAGSLLAIRICGTVTILLITGVTLVSTALAIKTQYWILALIALSLLAIFLGLGDVPSPEAAQLRPPPGGPSIGLLFGIFFPAVTGFTAGVNMSGDLRDPKRSIPVGTLAAIGAGLATYVGLAVFLVYRVPGELLASDGQILQRLAGPLGFCVVAGIWGATISSAMGSILGAPRILQALGADRVMPRFFAKGAGRSAEPRRALVLAFAIAEVGILIGELDAIARIVSIFFMATYGFLNLSCAVESWASTDFRPSFRIPRMVSVIGGVTCLLIMVRLDLLAMAGATVLFVGLFAWLKRRELALESGDTWIGVWHALVRTNLTRLSRLGGRPRDYRPNLLCFSRQGARQRARLLSYGRMLTRQRGLLTDFELLDGASAEAPAEPAELRNGVFRRALEGDDQQDAVLCHIRYYGFAGLVPNTLLLPLEEGEQAQLLAQLQQGARRDMTLILLAAGAQQESKPAEQRRVDIWWSPERGRFSLALTLAGYLGSSDDLQLATLRLLLIADERADADYLHRSASRLRSEARLDASVKILRDPLGERAYGEWVQRESQDADLTVLALPNDLERLDATLLRRCVELARSMGDVLFVRAASGFAEPLRLVAAPERSALDAPRVQAAALGELPPRPQLPALSELASEARRVSDRLEAVAMEFERTCLALFFQAHRAELRRAVEATEALFGELEGLVDGPGASRGFARAFDSYLERSVRILEVLQRRGGSSLAGTLVQRIQGYQQGLVSIREGAPASRLTLRRPARDGEAGAAGEAGGQWGARIVVPLEALLLYHLDHQGLAAQAEALSEAARQSYRSLVGLSKAFDSTRSSLVALQELQGRGELRREVLVNERRKALAELQAVADDDAAAEGELCGGFLLAVRQISSELILDLERPDLRKWIRRERRIPRSARDVAGGLLQAPEQWLANEALLARRAELELLMAGFQHRLRGIAQRTKQAWAAELGGGVARDLGRLLQLLQRCRQVVDAERVRQELARELGQEVDYERLVEALVTQTQAAAVGLPESFRTLDMEAILQLEEAPLEEMEAIQVSVRRRVELLVQTELVGRMRERMLEAAALERRALAVARDVLRLVSFNVDDLQEEGSQERLAGRMGPILDEGIERLQVELAEVEALVPGLMELADQQLELVVARTDAFAITGSEDGLRQRTAAGGASRGVKARLGQGVAWVQRQRRELLMRLFYRRSAGMVLAQQRLAGLDPQEVLVEQVLRFVGSNTPRPEVLEALPFHYQQLFLGKTRISADFWIGRDEEMAVARRAIENARLGSRGALIVTGERNSGKSALCRSIANHHFAKDRIQHVLPPPGGSCDPAAFLQALQVALGSPGSESLLFSTLPEGSVLVLHDMELWFQRSEGGLRVLELIRGLIEEHGARCFFILNIGIRALRFIRRLLPLGDQALAILQCGPLAAEDLKEIIMLRHRSTGLGFSYDGHAEQRLPAWRLARLFNRIFDYASGALGVAMQSWIASIQGVEGKQLELVAPVISRGDILHELPMEWIGLLLELVIHKQVSFARFQELTALDPEELRHQLNTLTRMRLVTEDKQGVLEINRYVDHLVTAHLRERGLLA